jgi:anti-sigma factor RsiW
MQLKHLSDEEIQDYLDGNLSKAAALKMEEHLEACPRCREALKQYQNVCVGLEDDRGFELPRGFAKAVVRRLPAEGETESRFNYLNVFLAILGIIVAAGGTLYFVDLRPLGRAFSHVLPGPELGSGLLALIENLLIGLNGNVGFLIFALLTLILVAVLDRLVFQPKYKRVSLRT